MENSLRIDFHSHILPKVDHGSSSMETSIKQLKISKKCGVDYLVSTSHFYPHDENVEEFITRRNAAFVELMECCEENQISVPKVLLGAEVLLCKGMQKMDGLEKLCIQGTNVILLEMPFSKTWDKELVRTFLQIKRMGFTTVLAHADRYDKKAVGELLEYGVDVQLNTNSLKSYFGRKAVRSYFEEDCVVAFGSDLHGADSSYSSFDKVMKKLGKKADYVQEKTAELLLLS